jgi:hypothetical protein
MKYKLLLEYLLFNIKFKNKDYNFRTTLISYLVLKYFNKQITAKILTNKVNKTYNIKKSNKKSILNAYTTI